MCSLCSLRRRFALPLSLPEASLSSLLPSLPLPLVRRRLCLCLCSPLPFFSFFSLCFL